MRADARLATPRSGGREKQAGSADQELYFSDDPHPALRADLSLRARVNRMNCSTICAIFQMWRPPERAPPAFSGGHEWKNAYYQTNQDYSLDEGAVWE